MIKLRHQQPSLWTKGLAEDMEDLWEPWMRVVDQLLEDEALLDSVYEAQGERYPQSRSRGRMQTPTEVKQQNAREKVTHRHVLPLLLLAGVARHKLVQNARS
jgi:hypothetical protein